MGNREEKANISWNLLYLQGMVSCGVPALCAGLVSCKAPQGWQEVQSSHLPSSTHLEEG